jgi:uncharacterized lipoprotein YbaY
MKHLLIAAGLGLGLSGAAAAQAQADKPAAPASVQLQQGAAASDPARTGAVRRGRTRADADARACLQFPTNMEIHRCSLKYR